MRKSSRRTDSRSPNTAKNTSHIATCQQEHFGDSDKAATGLKPDKSLEYTTTPEKQLDLSDNHHQIQLFLAISAVGLLYVIMLVYIITRNIIVLGTTTVVGGIALIVYNYYFKDRNDRK